MVYGKPLAKNKFFMGDDQTLYNVLSKKRSDNTLIAEDKYGRIVVFPLSEVRRIGYKAFTKADLAKMLNRSPRTIARIIEEGGVPSAQQFKNGGLWLFSKKAVLQAHKYVSMRNKVGKRNRQYVTIKNMPTRQELIAQMEHGMVMYARDDEGNFIRVWEAEEW